LPLTYAGRQVSIGCFTYSCGFSGDWTTDSSGCECQPGLTYYSPCGNCGTVTRICSAAGTFAGAGSVCDDDEDQQASEEPTEEPAE
jgi:hypothetical protein